MEENKVMEQEYLKMQQKLQLLNNTVNNLKYKDREIYRSIFNADPLIVSLIGQENSLIANIDTTRDDIIISKSRECLAAMEDAVEMVKGDIATINDECEYLGESVRHIPSIVPLRGFSIGQAGASVGKKINPFYKVQIMHNGLDMIAPSGAPVYAAADGVVRNVTRSRKGLGNVVEIDHGNGYVTRYAHLADVEVKKGRGVKKGTRLGYVGVSGNSFAPHLHYEVLRDTLVMDPVNHLFASVGPDDYMNMLIMAVSTGQSLD